MKKSVLYVLIALMLVIGAAAVACGGGDNGDNDSKEPTVAEEQDGQDQQEDTPEAEATPESDGDGESSGSFADVPVYPGAKKITSGEWSGSEAAVPAIGADVEAGDYTKVQYAMYETGDGAEDVLDWYKDKMGDWDSQGSFSGGEEGSLAAWAAWTKDDGKAAAWISIAEEDGTTTLSIFHGSQ